MNPGVLRLKLVLAEHGRAIAAVLAVASLLAFAGAAWAVANPPTETVTEQTHPQTVATDVATTAVVETDGTLWERGTRLEDTPVYPLPGAPNLTLAAHTTGPGGTRVTHELTLVYEARKDGTTIWRSERTLARDEETVADGNATTTATLDVVAVRERLQEINGKLTGIGRARALVRLNVSYDTGRYSGQFSETASLTVGQNGYWLGGSLAAERTHTTPVTRQVTRSNTGALGFAGAGLLAALGAAAVAGVRRRGLDARTVKHRLDRNRCEEWISEGCIRQNMATQDIAMHTLEGLVDVAIDSNKRVVFDPDRELYAVVDRGVVYYYDPNGDPEDVNTSLGDEVELRVGREDHGSRGAPEEGGGRDEPAGRGDPAGRDRPEAGRPADGGDAEEPMRIEAERGYDPWEGVLDERGNGHTSDADREPEATDIAEVVSDLVDDSEDDGNRTPGHDPWNRLLDE